MLLEVENLRVRFETPHGPLQAVDQVSFRLDEGETLGLVGESGSGKTVSCLALLGLLPTPPAVIESGVARFEGRDLLTLAPEELRRLRGHRLAMVFQDPMTALNPFLTIGRQLTEVLEVHLGTERRAARRRAAAALGEVGIAQPETRLDQYPHELSGGQRQRVVIAMALMAQPRLVFADEPTTALDVTIQAQILDLLRDLQERHGTALVLITHDLGVVAGMADRVHVMYAGRMVESASVVELFERPMHPYTLGLLQSVPRLSTPTSDPLPQIPGSPPDPSHLPLGCPFAPRCELRQDACETARPALEALPSEHVDPALRAAAERRARARSGSPLFLGGRRSACLELGRQAERAAAWRETFGARHKALRAALESRWSEG